MRSCAAAKLALATALLAFAGAAFAQEPQSGGEVIGKALDALHLRTAPPPVADFVKKSRPDPNSLDYKQLGPTEKSSKKKSPAELDELGADLENALERNRKAAARVKIPDAPAALGPRASQEKQGGVGAK